MSDEEKQAQAQARALAGRIQGRLAKAIDMVEGAHQLAREWAELGGTAHYLSVDPVVKLARLLDGLGQLNRLYSRLYEGRSDG